MVPDDGSLFVERRYDGLVAEQLSYNSESVGQPIKQDILSMIEVSATCAYDSHQSSLDKNGASDG